MIIKFITAIIIAVIFFISVYVFGTCKRNSVGIISGALAVLMFVGFILVPWSFSTVNSGSVAVVKHLGKILISGSLISTLNTILRFGLLILKQLHILLMPSLWILT